MVVVVAAATAATAAGRCRVEPGHIQAGQELPVNDCILMTLQKSTNTRSELKPDQEIDGRRRKRRRRKENEKHQKQ
ncbi:hypothetical protein AJ78_08697, partial [Emergomyces pasteurianus Ep9510]